MLSTLLVLLYSSLSRNLHLHHKRRVVIPKFSNIEDNDERLTQQYEGYMYFPQNYDKYFKTCHPTMIQVLDIRLARRLAEV